MSDQTDIDRIADELSRKFTRPQDFDWDRHIEENTKALTELAALKDVEIARLEGEVAKWLAWSDGQYPDSLIGDVIAAYPNGSIVLDDGLTTWNPLRALEAVSKGIGLQGCISPEKELLDRQRKTIEAQEAVAKELGEENDQLRARLAEANCSVARGGGGRT